MVNKKAIYPLSADPLHRGHLDSIKTAAKLFDHVYVSLGTNPKKNYLFNTEERLSLAKKAIYAEKLANVTVEPFSGLLRNHSKQKGIEYIVRGCRNANDWEYETVLADFNSELELQTLIFPSKKKFRSLSSTLVKSIVQEYGLVHDYVHPAVKQALEEKMLGISLVGVTGNMGAGKTTLCKELVNYSELTGTQINHLNLDELVREIYQGTRPCDLQVREEIESSFGEKLFDKKNKRRLAEIVFGDDKKRIKLAEILKKPLITEIETRLRDLKGIVLVDAAYFTEYNLLPIVNYNILNVVCNEDERVKRIFERDNICMDDLYKKIRAQHTQKQRKKIIQDSQKALGHGFYSEVDTSQPVDYFSILKKLVDSFPGRKNGP